MAEDDLAGLRIAQWAASKFDPADREKARMRAEAAGMRVAAKFAEAIQAEEVDDRISAAIELARWVENAFGEEAEALCENLRATGALAFVLQMMFEADTTLVCISLMLISNFVCVEFDPRGAGETSQEVLKSGVFERLKDLCLMDDAVIVGHACACLQNLCKELAFAKLVLGFELESELNRIVKDYDDEYVKQCAAGALSNTLEAVQRAAMAASLDRAEAAVGGRGGGRKRGAFGIMSTAFGEQPPTEVELEDEVVEALARAEAERLREEADREEAARFIQSVMRVRKATKAFRMLIRLTITTKLMVRWIRKRRRKRKRRAALTLQAHFRAYLCARRGICAHTTIVILIDGLRRIHNRAVCRRVYEAHPELQPPDLKLPGLPTAVRRQWLQKFQKPFAPFRWQQKLGLAKGKTPAQPPAHATQRMRIRPVIAPASQPPPPPPK